MAFTVTGCESLLGCSLLDLQGRPMDQHWLNVEGSQQGDIQKEVANVFPLDNSPIKTDHKNLVPKTGDVLKDTSEVSEFHLRDLPWLLLKY